MSPNRRTTAPRKRPEAGTAVDGGFKGPGDTTPPQQSSTLHDEPSVQFDAEQASQDLLSEVQDLLRANTELDESQREAFGAHFAQALQAVVQDGQATASVDQGVWADALASMEADGEVNASDAADLSRRVSTALAPLERRPTKIALEFSRRMLADGNEQALAWLREQRAEGDAAVSSEEIGAVGGSPVNVGSNEVTKSRSRRLRGPPAGS